MNGVRQSTKTFLRRYAAGETGFDCFPKAVVRLPVDATVSPAMASCAQR